MEPDTACDAPAPCAREAHTGFMNPVAGSTTRVHINTVHVLYTYEGTVHEYTSVQIRVDCNERCSDNGSRTAVIAKMDHLTEKGLVLCTICGQKFTSEITHLSEPIDVYSEWIDACEEANM
eukprot:12669-Pelagococcus_subviridis.AAC.6